MKYLNNIYTCGLHMDWISSEAVLVQLMDLGMHKPTVCPASFCINIQYACMHEYFLPLSVYVAEYLEVTFGCRLLECHQVSCRIGCSRVTPLVMTSYLACEEATHTDDAEDVEDS